jgi:3-hydroxyacyl-[acyl-carrier-protein] dehydratase
VTAVAGPAGYGLADIAAVLPHRHPMLLVDRVVELEPGASVLATKAVTATEPWFRGADPADPATEYPPVLVIESWCQAAALLAAWSRRGSPELADLVALFGGMSELRLGRPVRPGDVLEHRARIVRDLGDTWIFEGETRVGDTVVLEVGSAMTALRPAAVLREAAP